MPRLELQLEFPSFSRIGPQEQRDQVARCEDLIGKHRGMFTDRTALELGFDPDKLTVEQLDLLLMQHSGLGQD